MLLPSQSPRAPGPDIVSFIKKRQPVVTMGSTVKEFIVDQRERGEESVTGAELAASNQWLHMDVVEKEKMEWMSDAPVIKNPPNVHT